ncbi:MAG: squalene/phytoene synthase family protein [Asticcacaulis sp.]
MSSPVDTDSETEPRDDILRLSYAFIDDEAKRAQALAVAAFLELLREVPQKVSEPLLGDIRYTWWYEAINEIAEGRKVRYHPLSAALETLIRQHGLEAEVFREAIDAYRLLLEEGRMSLKQALELVDAADVALIRQAARQISPDTDTTALSAPVRFYALALMRAQGLLNADEAGDTEYRHLYREARQALKTLPSKLLPLALPAALATDRWTGHRRGPLGQRFKLFWVFLTGRI